MAVDLDGHGNVIAAGASLVEEEEDLAVIKLKGENGDEIWRHEIGGTGFCEIFCERARSVMVDATGNVIAAGQLTNGETAEDLVVVKLLPEPSPWILRLAALGAVALLVTQRSNRLRKKSHFGGSRRVTQICD